MKARPQLQDRLLRVGANVATRLDKLGNVLPETKPEMPLEEYLARASVHAQGDQQFGQQLRDAMKLYDTTKGMVGNGLGKRLR